MSTRKNRGFSPPSAKKHAVITYGKCEQPRCRKIRFRSRRDAKSMAKKLYPGDHLSVYQCGDWWHMGHPPQRVIAGRGWGSEDYLERQAQRVLDEAQIEPVECNGCGWLIEWSIGEGYVHECEVVGLDDREGNDV